MTLRLQKYLAEAGIASRRASEELITAGRIRVNGETATLGMSVDPEKDTVLYDGKPVKQEEELITIMLYKPKGVVSTSDDPQGRTTVQEYVKDIPARLYNIGRLDINSEGLLLMTNDGEFANLLTHPRHEVAKVYRVTVHPKITPEQEMQLMDGIEDNGELLLARSVTLLDEDESRSVLQIVLTGGKNRQIRRMCEAVGLEVARLKRVSEGGVKLGMLPPGRWRHLEPGEIRMLKAAARGEVDPARGGQGKRGAESNPTQARPGDGKGFKSKPNFGRGRPAKPEKDRTDKQGNSFGEPFGFVKTGGQSGRRGQFKSRQGGKEKW